jgi:hypothetical protein
MCFRLILLITIINNEIHINRARAEGAHFNATKVESFLDNNSHPKTRFRLEARYGKED